MLKNTTSSLSRNEETSELRLLMQICKPWKVEDGYRNRNGEDKNIALFLCIV